LVLALALAGCSGGGMPTTHYYVLRPPSEPGVVDAVSANVQGLRVGVDSIAVDPPYDQDRFVYRERIDSPEVGFYAYHRWASPLGRLLQVALADGLSGVSGIAMIEPVRSDRDYDARLGGRLLFLEEVGGSDGQEVRMSLELVLRAPSGNSLWSERLEASAGGDSAEVPQVIALAQQAFDSVLADASAGLAAASAAVDN
jgi:uncharacterized lipoprotein YmbA